MNLPTCLFSMMPLDASVDRSGAGWGGIRQKGSCIQAEKKIGGLRTIITREVKNHWKHFFYIKTNEIQSSCCSSWMVFITLLHLMSKLGSIEWIRQEHWKRMGCLVYEAVQCCFEGLDCSNACMQNSCIMLIDLSPIFYRKENLGSQLHACQALKTVREVECYG